MNLNFQEIKNLVNLPDNFKQVYSWKTLPKKDPNYEPGDIGLLDLIGTPEDSKLNNLFLGKSIWETKCTLYDAKVCLDIGKIQVSYMGYLDYSSEYLLYFNIWIKIQDLPKGPPLLDFNLLISRSLSEFYQLYDNGKGNGNESTYTLGKVQFLDGEK